MKLTENKLRYIIRESIYNILREHDPDEIEYDSPDPDEVKTIYYNEIAYDAFCEYYSNNKEEGMTLAKKYYGEKLHYYNANDYEGLLYDMFGDYEGLYKYIDDLPNSEGSISIYSSCVSRGNYFNPPEYETSYDNNCENEINENKKYLIGLHIFSDKAIEYVVNAWQNNVEDITYYA